MCSNDENDLIEMIRRLEISRKSGFVEPEDGPAIVPANEAVVPVGSETEAATPRACRQKRKNGGSRNHWKQRKAKEAAKKAAKEAVKEAAVPETPPPLPKRRRRHRQAGTRGSGYGCYSGPNRRWQEYPRPHTIQYWGYSDEYVAPLASYSRNHQQYVRNPFGKTVTTACVKENGTIEGDYTPAVAD